MKASEAKFLDFLKKSPQFVIPIYQRTYSWTEKECRQLWEDILRTGRNDQISAHFVGSIVYVEKGLYQYFINTSCSATLKYPAVIKSEFHRVIFGYDQEKLL